MNEKPFSGIAQCPYCLLPYTEGGLKVVKKEKNRQILHVFCEYCRHAMLFLVRKRMNGMICTGVFTDCDFEDAKTFLAGEKISADDVLEVRQALQFDNFLEMR